ncbi:DnaJ C-terminal domain-containing protein [Yoonia sediminilitoris]|uniref:Curved DNA-binding protein n=1 Tax=Yoonia sediminilitoris TaxID=1286148 RepID=A0A2T6KIQ8_9RHOB|nr:DnaJ C-terminal domain-containing protein [Yoonia sediminilitoris]PUB15610.1 curved DNA-binding protein [Yoonia sediminilitoris]RCW96219.1 curved DNA-binding protein [Yoonia sediminilitoris]
MVDNTHYEALGVPRDASADDIKRAYRKMARKYHPDVATDPDADAKFKAAGEAYSVLSDPESRAAYDRYGADWDQPRPEPDQQRAGAGSRWGGGFAFDDRDINADSFRDFFGGRFGGGFGGGFDRSAMQRDQHARIEIPLEDAVAGAKRAVTLQMPQLDQTGHVTMEQRTIDLTIPKGVMPGQQLRLRGLGTAGGDLFVEIAFQPHPVYRIEGRDLFVALPVTPWEAALGGKVKMPTPTGKVDLKIPPNARHGQKLRLRGRGLPGAQKGDLYAVLHIVNPPNLSQKARDLYRQLASESSYDPRSNLGA